MNEVTNMRLDNDVRRAKTILTQLSNRNSELYYYNSGHARYTDIQSDTIIVMDVIEKLIAHIEMLEKKPPVVRPQAVFEVRKQKSLKLSKHWWVKRKTDNNGGEYYYLPFWAKPINAIYNLVH